MDLYYLPRLVLQFSDIEFALTAYNFGPGFVRNRLKTKGKLPLTYSRKVLHAHREFSPPLRVNSALAPFAKTLETRPLM